MKRYKDVLTLMELEIEECQVGFKIKEMGDS
jgi:hypothetical protein